MGEEGIRGATWRGSPTESGCGDPGVLAVAEGGAWAGCGHRHDSGCVVGAR